MEGRSHLLQGKEGTNRIRLSKRMNLNLRGDGAGANLVRGRSWAWPASVQQETQGNKGIAPWDMTGPEDEQLRSHKTNVWIQGLKVDIRSSNFNLQKSSESASDVRVPYPFCPSTHAGLVSQVTVPAACNRDGSRIKQVMP